MPTTSAALTSALGRGSVIVRVAQDTALDVRIRDHSARVPRRGGADKADLVLMPSPGGNWGGNLTPLTVHPDVGSHNLSSDVGNETKSGRTRDGFIGVRATFSPIDRFHREVTLRDGF
ncbi:hypothetical protein BC834DRAFT_895973 [Gloeopeniophorella convolvens]|nr:hypothetical protein BC834DRAFT_895973 [Gloeopeniophorella convolvens]